MTTTMHYDRELSDLITRIYATADIANTRSAVAHAVHAQVGEYGLDVGCGPGYLTKELAQAVSETGGILGVDISDAMLDLARIRCRDLPQICFERRDCLDLPAADTSVDFACVLQVYAYVPELDEALAELRRVLKPGGRIVILDSDFSGLVWESWNRKRMRKILEAYDRHVAWPDLPRVLPHRLQKAGFKLDSCSPVPFLTLRYRPDTYVHGLAQLIHAFLKKDGTISSADADAWLSEFDDLERNSAFFFAMDRYMFVAHVEE